MIVKVSDGEVVGPLLAVAVLVTLPASRSAWVTVWVAVQVIKRRGPGWRWPGRTRRWLCCPRR